VIVFSNRTRKDELKRNHRKWQAKRGASVPFVRIRKGVRIRFLDFLLWRKGKEVHWRNYRKLAAELFIRYTYIIENRHE
jgi:hypothetical protein